MTEEARKKEVVSRLHIAYPNAHIALVHWKTPWELLVAVVLSAQCTDIMVNKVTETLFTTYKTLDDYVHADISVFEQAIKSTGFYHNKAKNILAAAKLIQEKFNGHVPQTMEELLTVPGVARKTANVVLGNAFGIVEGIAVDTHVIRLSQRLRLVDLDKIGGRKILYVQKNNPTAPPLTLRGGREELVIDFKKDADPVKIEQELMQTFPKSDWFAITYRLIDHGRAICKAQKPDCSHCVLSDVCPSSRV